jgi:hypothetical protein
METKITTVNERFAAAGQTLARHKREGLEKWKQGFVQVVASCGYLDALRSYGEGLLRTEAEASLALQIEMDCQADRPAEKLTARITDFTLTLIGLVDQMDGGPLHDLTLEIRIKALRSMTRAIQTLLLTVEGDQP